MTQMLFGLNSLTRTSGVVSIIIVEKDMSNRFMIALIKLVKFEIGSVNGPMY